MLGVCFSTEATIYFSTEVINLCQICNLQFNETYAFIECENGSVELGPDYWVRVTTEAGTLAKRCVPPNYKWIDPLYHVVQASIAPCHADLLRSLQTGQPAATSGEDNLETMRLVDGAYQSAQTGQVIKLLSWN